MEIFHTERKKTTLALAVIYLAATAVIALGYSIFYLEIPLPNGTTGQLLDIMDYISNSFLMPFISIFSTILVGWLVMGHRGDGASEWQVRQKAFVYCYDQVCDTGDHDNPVLTVYGTA